MHLNDRLKLLKVSTPEDNLILCFKLALKYQRQFSLNYYESYKHILYNWLVCTEGYSHLYEFKYLEIDSVKYNAVFKWNYPNESFSAHQAKLARLNQLLFQTTRFLNFSCIYVFKEVDAWKREVKVTEEDLLPYLIKSIGT